MLTLLVVSCTDQELVEKDIDQDYVKIKIDFARSSRAYFSELDSLTHVEREIGDTTTINTKLQGSRNYVIHSYSEEELSWKSILVEGEHLKNTEGETAYATYPASFIQDGVATLPATNIWRKENRPAFTHATGTISNGEVVLLLKHPFSYLKFTLAMVPEALSSVTTSDGDKTIHRVLVESASGSLGVVKGSFDFENQSMNITEPSKSVEVILEEGYQPGDSLVERAIYIPILPQEANVEMSIYALHDTETGCDTLFSTKKQTPSTGFLAGNVYKLGIRGNSTSAIVGDSLSIYLANAGQLSQYVTDAQKTSIKKLRVAGYLNGDDIRLIREMAGVDWGVNETNGQLTSLDISEATIVEGGGAYFADGDLVRYTENYIIGEYMFQYTKLTDIKMPENTIKIEGLAFRETPLVTVNVPNQVVSIGMDAFNGCVSLTNIALNESLESIGDYAFVACTSLISINLPHWISSVGECTFSGCTSLSSVVLHNYLTSIGDGAFGDCSALSSITLPNSITAIGRSAFIRCSSLSSITIPNSVISIGEFAFQGCSSLNNIVLSESLDSIAAYTFSLCSSLDNVTIPNSVSFIGEMAFRYCTSLSSITIPNSVNTIDGGAFSDCSSLTNIALSESLDSITIQTFYGCSALDNVIIPNSVTTIGDAAFYNCTSLSNVTLGKSITSIQSAAFGYAPIANCNIYAETPPTIDATSFNMDKTTATLNVPTGFATAYQDSDWATYWGNIVEM